VVPVAVAGHRQGIDRIDLIAGGDKGLHPQAAIRLDPDHHLIRFPGVASQEPVKLADTGQPLR
jgi:hypothetical protein